jgi:uncharacterized protein YecE (DUF72 family)
VTRTIKVGLCGFTMAAARYPYHFRVVEVQQTFYQPPSAEVITRWRAQMPASFEFTLKAWMLITHTSKSPTYRRLRRTLTPAEAAGTGNFQASPIVDEAWRVSVDAARRLRATAILFQCPASFRPTPENLANLRGFFERIARPAGVRLLFEPRGPTWTTDVVRPLVEELQLVHVVDPFVHTSASTDLTYFRLHGITGSRHVYSDAELTELATKIPADVDAYIMFNNIPRVGDAERFKPLVGLPQVSPEQVLRVQRLRSA